jgi:predicted transcriptional regulator
MDANLDKIAKDLYGKIQTRFRNIKIGDENAEVLSKKEDIPRARFFEFEYEEGGAPLGTIAITLDPQDGVVMQVSGDLTDDDNATHHGAYRFIRGFRQFAKDRLLNFDVQNIGKSNLDKRDYEYQAKRKEMPIMPAIMENKLYGSNRISYQDLGEARLVIKHSQPINLDLPAGRTMHIESIYIENNSGERFKYPYKHLNGARALAEHIKHGGNPYDNIGQHICSLSEELAHLRKFKGYVSRQEQLSEAMANVTSRVMERIETIKETINKLQRTAYYEAFVESFEDQEEQMIPEEVQNDLIDRLTIRTFNEELKSVFPYIYKFIDESEIDVVELGADDLISEKQLSERVTPEWLDIYSKAKELLAKGMSPEQVAKQLGVQGPNNGMAGGMGGNWGAINKAVNELKQSQKPSFESAEDQFENFMNDIVREDKNEVISSNNDAQSAAIEKLNTILAQNMQVGPNGDNAIMTLKGLIDEPSFIDAVKAVPAETDLNDLIKGWIETEHEDLLGRLEFPSDEAAQEPAPAPTEPAPDAAAPAPVDAEPAPAAATAPAPAPVSEDKDDDNDPPWHVDPKDKKSKPTTPGKHGQGYSQARHLARQGLADTLKKAKKAGATLETQMDFGSKVMTIAEVLESCGMTPQDVGYEAPEQEGGLPGMLKYISGFYNKDEGNFPLGGMRVKIKVKKAFEDGEFDGAGEEDLLKVIKFIDAKDPSGNEHNQITRLAGIQKPAAQAQPKQGLDISALETQLQSISETPTVSYGQDQSLASIVHLAGLAK